MSVTAALSTPRSWGSPGTLLWMATSMVVALTAVPYVYGILPKWFFFIQFVLWRLAYNVGIGYTLHRQSEDGHFVRLYKRWVARYPRLRSLLECSVVFKDGQTTYRTADFPDEFNAWMLFRQVENIILSNDLISYGVLSLVCWRRSDSFSPLDALCLLLGGATIVFALWSKSDAHRVVGDFAWYWGDFFFLLDANLTFDGIFQMFPHPMYTVGYAFMYGVPLMARSYSLFYLSVCGHLCQIAFLALVENPHIDRTYNAISQPTEEEQLRNEVLYGDGSEGCAYLEPDELVVLMHFNVFRANDWLLVIIVLYMTVSLFFSIPAWAYVAHSLAWRLFHNGFLGCLLRWESQSKWFSRNYDSPQSAFGNWKRIYNASVTLTNVSYCLCAVKLGVLVVPVLGGGDVRVFIGVVGALLIGINAYVSYSIYHAIGSFGYFYGDFFITDIPSTLNYSGVYRYLNNPDTSLGMSAYYGVALLSGSPVVLSLAVFSHVCTKAFQALVEEPHMRKRYGTQIRSQGGIRSELRRRLQNSKQEYESRIRRLREEIEKKSALYEKVLQTLGAKDEKGKTA